MSLDSSSGTFPRNGIHEKQKPSAEKAHSHTASIAMETVHLTRERMTRRRRSFLGPSSYFQLMP